MTLRQTTVAGLTLTVLAVVGLTAGSRMRGSDVGFYLMYFGLAAAVVVSVLLLLVSIVAVHELGHVVAARTVGYELAYFQIGRMTWTRFRGRYLFSENPLSWLRGFTLPSVPAKLADRWRYLLFVSGGVLAQLLLIALLLIWWALLPPNDHPLLSSILILIALFHGLFLTGSLVPYQERGMRSDGLHFYTACKQWPYYVRGLAEQRIWGQMRDLTPLDQLSEEDIALCLSDSADLEAYASGLVVRFCQLEAAGRTQEALATIEKAMSLTPMENAMYGPVRIHAVYAYAWYAGDAARANDAWMSIPTTWPESIGYLAAKASLRFVQGEYREAAEIAERAMANATETPGTWQAYPGEVEKLREISDRSRAALAAT